ncbi:MAG: GntR family transcriptional regulator [Lentisphaeria bacterium]|nr:GntR family transcriptional regulator [Lentisphaeria bacterium]
MALKSSPTKKQQVIDAILENILSGAISPGERLAKVREMSQHFKVSLCVIQNALRELVTDGFIECRGASGFFVLPNRSESCAKNGAAAGCAVRSALPEKMFLSCLHHSDLVWNRTYVEYAQVRKEQIDQVRAYFAKYPDFHFHFDQAEVVRVYLEQHPEALPEFRQYVKEGRLELLGGLAIPDLNLCQGESLLRNLLQGRAWYNRHFGIEPEIGGMMDAFGMCSQLPQILQLAGYRYLVPGRMPNLNPAIDGNRPFLWQGLDGSRVVVANSAACVTHQGYVTNVPVIYPPSVRLGQTVASLKQLEGDALVFYFTELGVLEEDLFWIIEVANRQGGRPVTFGRVADFMARIDSSTLPLFSGEMNPVFSGCYTTRIAVKQGVRKAEHLLFQAEALAALSECKVDFDPLWHELILTQFHDAICGCHTDKANQEIEEKITFVQGECQSVIERSLDQLSAGPLTVFNPHPQGGLYLVEAELDKGQVPAGVPVQRLGDQLYFEAELPALGTAGFQLQKEKNASSSSEVLQGTNSIATPYFQANFKDGRAEIVDVQSARNVFGSNFGEILFRWDNGSMWTESFMNEPCGSECQDEELVEISEGPLFFQVVTAGRVRPGRKPKSGNHGDYWTGFGSLAFRREFIFPKHQPYFRLNLQIDWQGKNTKVGIRFPVRLEPANAVGTYAVPFGSMIRRPYFEVPCEYASTAMALNRQDYQHASGDWPALDWINYSDNLGGLSIANSGTPGHQLVGKNILVALLRSGSRCADGSMYPQEGSFDQGRHTFAFAFQAHSPAELGKAVQLGALLNRPPLCRQGKAKTVSKKSDSLFQYEQPNIALSAIHTCPDGGILVRLYESIGRSEPALKIDTKYQVFVTDCRGQNAVLVSDQTLSFTPFEVKTIKLTSK